MKYKVTVTIMFDLNVEATNVDEAESVAVDRLLAGMSDITDYITIVDASVESKAEH